MYTIFSNGDSPSSQKERLISWQTKLRGDSVSWLLQSGSPDVRYLAMRDLLDLPPDDKKLKAARKLAHKEGLIAHVLSKMDEKLREWEGLQG